MKRIRPYIHVRPLDKLLILIPNQAYRMNESGIAILDYLLKGHGISDFLALIGNTEEKRRDIHFFFCDLRAAVSGCLHECEKRVAVSYYEFSGQFNEYPILSELAITYRCNLNCEFCYVGDRSCREVTTNDAKKILYKIYHEAQVPSVSFTGGEPLLREDLGQLVAYASSIGMWTNLITNGTLLNKDIVEDLRRAGLSSTQVSLEGSGSRIHDKITGVPGSFDATMKGINLLLEAEIPVHTNTTLSRNNVDDIEDLVLLLKGMGLERFSMNLLIPCGAALDKRHLWMSYSDIGHHILRLKHYADQHNIKFLWYSPIPLCKFNPIAYGFGNKACAAITGLLSIDPEGNVLPCSSWREPVGSLLKQNFKDLWHSAMVNYFKNIEYAPAGCHECVHLDVCKGGFPLYWQACGTKELSGRK